MGLLDDAIREHLDLKRARGGDPAEIERMEREALGPVRREPPIGSTRFDNGDEPLPRGFEEPHPRGYQDPEFHEEHLTDLEELQELGYHDSTAPHLHGHHEHVHTHHDHLDPLPGFDDPRAEHHEPEVQEFQQPKRRFLRRNRPASLSEPVAPDPGFQEDFHQDFHGDLPTEHHDLLDHPEALAHEQPGPAHAEPPHLQFEHPPRRPRFTAEPPSTQADSALEHEPAPEPLNAAPPAPAAPEPAPAAPAPAPAAPAAPEPAHADTPASPAPADQETTEFDVQKHLAEAPHGENENLLEETPDFLQDTPEHDRLWFEQRPPKDFDFNG